MILKFLEFITEGNIFAPEHIKEGDKIVRNAFNNIKNVDISDINLGNQGYSLINNHLTITYEDYFFRYTERGDEKYAIFIYKSREIEFSKSLFYEIYRYFKKKKYKYNKIKRREKEQIEEYEKTKTRKSNLDYLKSEFELDDPYEKE